MCFGRTTNSRWRTAMINYIKIGLVIAILGAFCYIVWDYKEVKAENERLTTELSAANSTITALDNLAKANEAIRAKTDGLIGEIENEPETNDADTAPVLLNAINRLR